MKYGPRPKGITRLPVNNYRLSRLAAADLEEIAEYTIERFGINQARRYRDGLKTCFDQLAENHHSVMHQNWPLLLPVRRQLT